ncbi:hypothetical protein FBY35_2446 [Streptomyces sp. SLBN-118]|nr:hypothetical protein FBY35_2446 [Streptomyces sp. SLBN-118]
MTASAKRGLRGQSEDRTEYPDYTRYATDSLPRLALA